MNIEEMETKVENLEEKCILVIGDMMLDKFINGSVSRISPEAPVPVVDVTTEMYELGGAANAIGNIRVLGGNVIAAGAIGDDWYGGKLAGMLDENGVNTECLIICKERPTTVKTRVTAGQQQIVRIDRESREPINSEVTENILDFVVKKIRDIDALLISDYDKGVITDRLLDGLIPLAKKFGKPIVVYPKVEHFLDYKGVTVVISNLEKAGLVAGIKQINETSIRNMGQWLLTHLECEYVLITRGKDGMSVFERNGNVTHIPAIDAQASCVTGAGDIVASLIALSLASSGTIRMVDSAILANIAAGIVVKKLGSAPSSSAAVTKIELKNQINSLKGLECRQLS